MAALDTAETFPEEPTMPPGAASVAPPRRFVAKMPIFSAFSSLSTGVESLSTLASLT